MSGQANEDLGVDVDGLNSALNDLVKAAGATDVLTKGGDANGVEHSGTIDEDGKKGGGRGSMSDAGGTTSMMIGKMIAAGFDASMVAKFAEFVGKAEEGEDDEESDEDGDEGMAGKISEAMAAYRKENGNLKGFSFGKSDTGAADGEPLHKSMDTFRADPRIDDALDVSAFLEGYTANTAKQIDALNSTLAKSAGEQRGVNKAVAGAIYQMGQLMKSQVAVINEMGARLGIVERQPMPQRGVTTQHRALTKSLPNETGSGGSLKKSEVCAVLSYMNLEKGIKDINGQRTVEAIGMLEGGGQVSQDVIDAAESFVARNPAEATVARRYA